MFYARSGNLKGGRLIRPSRVCVGGWGGVGENGWGGGGALARPKPALGWKRRVGRWYGSFHASEASS